jgi:hypothetical protein
MIKKSNYKKIGLLNVRLVRQHYFRFLIFFYVFSFNFSLEEATLFKSFLNACPFDTILNVGSQNILFTQSSNINKVETLNCGKFVLRVAIYEKNSINTTWIPMTMFLNDMKMIKNNLMIIDQSNMGVNSFFANFFNKFTLINRNHYQQNHTMNISPLNRFYVEHESLTNSQSNAHNLVFGLNTPTLLNYDFTIETGIVKKNVRFEAIKLPITFALELQIQCNGSLQVWMKKKS